MEGRKSAGEWLQKGSFVRRKGSRRLLPMGHRQRGRPTQWAAAKLKASETHPQGIKGSGLYLTKRAAGGRRYGAMFAKKTALKNNSVQVVGQTGGN